MIGPEGTPQSARTRVGVAQIRERLATDSRIDRDAVKAMLFADRNGMADLLRDDLVARCRATPLVAGADGKPVDLAKACTILAAWDGRDHSSSVGAFLFRRWLERLSFAPSFWRVPFDPAQPLATPRGIAVTDTEALPALAATVAAITAEGLAIDAPLGAVQYVERGGERIAVPGGPTPFTYNVMDMSAVPGRGYVDPVLSGATYVAVIGFEGGQMRADAILASGQSSDPASPLHIDGVRRFSTGNWRRLPFTPAEVEAQAVGPAIELNR
ncbi:hypothetical protein FJQ54_10855 [Sandaracinobacter neustonicus]|uniref:Uncharacterized protein n=1 Tax=Sandaracinobacter neustonicus TaxID=1715348 RepID=A0A501XIX8_9SPHN|nr:hypothetical protein FJQ54_10855 [Sandaracinobacter neustonicus]